MNKRDFNVVGNEGTDNQELAKGIAFIKSRRAELNVVQMVENMRDQAMPNGVIINDAYCDRSMTRDYDREGLNAFFATLKEEDFEVALQFLTQMQSTKSRYLTLSILGARREQIKRSIYKQVLWYFLLPLMLACISGTVGLYAMQQHLYSDSTRIGQSYPLLIIMAFTVVLIMAIYGVAVARTATREIGKINYKPNS